jgi:hypothetical protein
MYRAPTPRERERWHALWLLALGWSAAKVAEVLDRDAHTIGNLARGLPPRRPLSAGLRADRWSPPALDAESQAGLKVAVQVTPAAVGIDLADWHWQVVRQCIEVRCGLRLSRSTCLR